MKYYWVAEQGTLKGEAKNVWEMLALRFGEIERYSYEVTASHYTSEQRQGVGTGRYCTLRSGGFMHEQVVEWNAGKKLGIEVLDTSYPLASGCRLWLEISQVDRQTVKINLAGRYRLRHLGFLSFLIRSRMKTLLRGYFQDIQRAIEI